MTRDYTVPPELQAPFAAGKLEKACPDCGRWEAASWFCSGCYRAMGPADWYRNGDKSRRAAARQNAPQKSQTPVNGHRGRPRRVSGPDSESLGL